MGFSHKLLELLAYGSYEDSAWTIRVGVLPGQGSSSGKLSSLPTITTSLRHSTAFWTPTLHHCFWVWITQYLKHLLKSS